MSETYTPRCDYCHERPGTHCEFIPSYSLRNEAAVPVHLCNEDAPRFEVIRDAYLKGHRLRRCPQCHEEFTVARSGRGRPNEFCSRTCQADAAKARDLAAKEALRRLPRLEEKVAYLEGEAQTWASQADRYRDEADALRAENARLRAEVAELRRHLAEPFAATDAETAV